MEYKVGVITPPSWRVMLTNYTRGAPALANLQGVAQMIRVPALEAGEWVEMENTQNDRIEEEVIEEIGRLKRLLSKLKNNK